MHKNSKNLIILFAVAVLLNLTAGVVSAAPLTQNITYQGKLADAAGNPLTGTYIMTFTVYNEDGTVFSTETHDVTVTDGLFTTPVAITNPAGVDGRSLWLGIKVGSDAEMIPRQEIRPVPYAISLRPGAWITSSDTVPALNLKNTGNGVGLNISTTGINGQGVFMHTYGPESIGVSAYTEGIDSHGFFASTSGDTSAGFRTKTYGTDSKGVTVYTAGPDSEGVYASTSGDSSEGVYAETFGYSSDGVVAQTSGMYSRGVNVSTAGAHSMGVNVFTTGWDSWGAYALTRGDDSHGFVSNVWGDNSNGVYTFTHGASSSGVRANTFGTDSDGVTAFTANTSSNAFSGVTLGDYGSGVNVSTQGHHAHGVNIGTTGKYSRGVIAQTSGDYADGLYLSTLGQYAEGVEASTSNDHSRGVNVTTTGTDSYGLNVLTSGSYSDGVRVSTSGSYSDGMHASASGVGADGVYASSTQANGIYANTGNTNREWGVYTPDYIYAGGIRAPDVDVAEYMPVTGDLSPGTVLIIGPDGRLQMASAANDTRVAGIISTSPAIALGTKENGNPGEEIIAVAGRVPCRVDATHTPIHAGDLLTTSDNPGYAMKATNPQIGTILGKAMGTLDSGTGTIEVLVTLQ